MTDRFSTPSAGLAIMSGAMLLAPFMDLFAKVATDYVVPGEVAMGRFIAQTAILLPIVFWLREMRMPGKAHIFAGICSAVAILAINSALKVMPIANALSIFFVEPLILTVLSSIFLKEKIGWRRMTAVGLGLVGTLVVLRPNVEEYGWAAVLPLVTAFAFAGYLLVLRAMSPGGGRIGLQFWIGTISALTLVIVLGSGTAAGIEELTLTWPPVEALALMAAAGALACVTHQMIAQAMARAEAGLLAPLQYLEIVTATGIGWLFFGEFPDQLTWLGTAIIISSGIFVFYRERKLSEEEEG